MQGNLFRASMLAAMLLPAVAGASIIRVGTGGSAGGCDTASLQTAINTAANRAGPDEIRLVQGYADNGQALTISGQDLTIRGGYENCADPDTSALERTYVNGTGGAAASVFTITGPGVVTLENLFIVGGDPLSTLGGGGIRYLGSSTAGSINVLTIRETNIEQNAGRFGGGIQFVGQGAPAVLELRTGTVIAHNEAIFRGGGVHVSGTATLDAQGDRVLFIDNRTVDNASGDADGGGLFVAQPAQADLAIADHDGFAAFDANVAAGNGGAIAAWSTDPAKPPTRVRVFSPAPDRPLSIARNSGTTGGAIFLLGNASAGPGAICLRNLNVIGNTARRGHVLAVERRGHLGLTRFDDADCGYPTPSFTCPAAAPCNVVAGNAAHRAAGVGGWLVGVQDGTATLRYATLRDNTLGGGALVAYGTGNGAIRLLDSLVARNAFDASGLVYAEGSYQVQVSNSTIAGNTATGTWNAVRLNGTTAAQVDRSILASSGPSIARVTGAMPVVEHVLVTTRGDLAGPTVYEGQATFVDAAGGNFRLQDGSPGIDSAPSNGASNADLDGNPRGIDSSSVPDRGGRVDLGAYESASAYFMDGFESDHFENGVDVPIPDNDRDGVDSLIAVSSMNTLGRANARIGVRIIHSFPGDLIVTLVAPSGRLFVLHNREGAGVDNIIREYPLDLSAEAINGLWRLHVVDVAAIDSGFIDAWSIDP